MFSRKRRVRVGLVCDRPSVDGNKRTTRLAMVIFVGKNNAYLDATEQSAYETINGLADGKVGEEELAGWVWDNPA